MKNKYCPNCGLDLSITDNKECLVCKNNHTKGQYCTVIGKNIEKYLKNEKEKLYLQFEKEKRVILRPIRTRQRIWSFCFGFFTPHIITLIFLIMTSTLTMVKPNGEIFDISDLITAFCIISIFAAFIGLCGAFSIRVKWSKKEKRLWEAFLQEKNIKLDGFK